MMTPAGATNVMPIAGGPADEHSPAISGERVVWQNDYAGKSAIYGLNLGSTPTRLTNPAGDDVRPQVDGDITVFERRSGVAGPAVDSDIWMYRFSTGAVSAVSDSPTTKYGPDVSGDKIVWYEFTGPTGWDIMIKDLATGAIYQLTQSPSKSLEPRISGNIVVWSDDRYGQFDIFSYDLSVDSDGDAVPNYRDGDRPSLDPAMTRITNNSSKQSNPDVSGRKLVWTDWREDGDIYYYDLDNPTVNGAPVDPSPAVQHSARISGNRVVWTDWRNESENPSFPGYNSDIYAKNLMTSAVTRITTDMWQQASPDVSGDHIIWADRRNGHWDIYMDVPDTVAPAASVIAPSISTKTSKTTKFKVRWTGSDAAPSSGLAGYDIQSKVGAGGSWAAWKSGTTATEATFAGKVGKTYYFRARATDGDGNVGAWSAEKQTIVPYDDSSRILKKRRGFNGVSKSARSNDYRGTVRYSTKRGNFLLYRFSGESVAIIARLTKKGAKAKIYIDGKFVKKINTRRLKTKVRKIVYSKALTKKMHTLKIVNLATRKRPRLDIDGIAVGQ